MLITKIVGAAHLCAAAVALAMAIANAVPAAAAEGATTSERPRLVVMISVDALSADLFHQWRGRASDGLARLAREGVVYPNGFQAHGITETCPGHASMVTGRHPSAHGITANGWYDTRQGRAILCARPLSVSGSGAAPNPGNLMVSALGDWMKAAAPGSRVYAIGGKDYAATMMGGRSPDGVFWYELSGRFARSSGASQALLDRINEDLRPLSEALGKPPARCAAGTSDSVVPQAAAFDYGDLDRLTLLAATKLIEKEGLGKGLAPDLLAISLSATDVIGHLHGASSWRMCEHGYTLDAALGAFFRSVEATGAPFLISLAADHGQSDVVEALALQGYEGVRRTTTISDLNAELRRRFAFKYDPIFTGGGRHSDLSDGIQLYVVDAEGRAMNERRRGKVVAAAVRWLSARPEVAAAFASPELSATPISQLSPEDEIPLVDRMRMSYVPGRSGDILVVYAPYMATFPMTPGRLVASHGSPYSYDRRIPIVFMGSGIGPQTRTLPIASIDIAPTIANALGISPPDGVDGKMRPLKSLPPVRK